MKTAARRARIKASMERRLGRAQEALHSAFEAELQRTLDDWGRRYPRHAFAAFQFHGMLSVKVTPPVCGISFLEEARISEVRGAVATLLTEVAALVDWHVGLEWTVATMDADILHSSPETVS